ncbi:MAG: transcriptional regulator [Methylocystaceae bacterium]|nr:MAG: transcriptional regulator [Methylocystaceae bacterium]
MNFQQLRFVREAVRNGLNLTTTSSALFTSQSGVSRQIKDLEDELGVEIFVRKGKRLVGLTKVGEGVLPFVEKILLEAENLRRYSGQFTKQLDGRLVIAATHNQARYVLPDVIQCFIAEFPNVHLELRQGTPHYVAQSIIKGDSDLGIATEALDTFPELITYNCFSWRHMAIVSTDHPLTAKSVVSLADLAQYPIITYNRNFTGRSLIDATFARAGLTPDIRLTAMDADVIKTYVELGLGIGIVAELAFDPQRDKTLVALVATKGLFEPNTTKVAIRRGALLQSYAYRLIELFAPRYSKLELMDTVFAAHEVAVTI